VYIDYRYITEFRGREAISALLIPRSQCHHDIYWISRRYVYPPWYCVQLFVDTIRDLSPLPYTFQNLIGKGKAQEKLGAGNTMKADDRAHRLSLPMTFMLRALDEFYIVITAYSYSPLRDDSGVNVNDGNENEASQPERKGIKKRVIEDFVLWKIGDREKKLL
jgi:hypothetical protein